MEVTAEVIIKALADELKQYSSLHVKYVVYCPFTQAQHTLRIKKVGYDRPMIVMLSGGKLRCRVLMKDDHKLWQERGGNIELADPTAIEQLLALLKKDLR